MPSTCQEITHTDFQRLRSMAGVKLTDSDCRVALRETKGNYFDAYRWLLENHVIDRINNDLNQRVAAVMKEVCRELGDGHPFTKYVQEMSDKNVL